jgi:hypothetical protein
MNPDLIVIQIWFLIHFGRILHKHATEGKILVTQVIWNCSSIKQMEAFKTAKQKLVHCKFMSIKQKTQLFTGITQTKTYYSTIKHIHHSLT